MQQPSVGQGLHMHRLHRHGIALLRLFKMRLSWDADHPVAQIIQNGHLFQLGVDAKREGAVPRGHAFFRAAALAVVLSGARSLDDDVCVAG
jgi:hypothetical protein